MDHLQNDTKLPVVAGKMCLRTCRTSLRISVIAALAAAFGSVLPAAKAGDYLLVAGSSLGRWDVATTWSPNGNPGAADNITGFIAGSGTQGLNLYGTRIISNVTYSSIGSDLSTVQIRPTVDSELTVNGNLTVDYGGGNLRILPNSSSSPQSVSVAVVGNINVSNGTLDFGAGTTQGLVALSQSVTSATTVGGTLNLHLRNAPNVTLGSLVLQTGGMVTLNTGGDGSSNTVTVSSLGGVGGVVNGGTSANRAARLTINVAAGATASYAGVLQNGHASSLLALTKAGDGTQILSGTRAYTGATSVAGGILRLTGTNYTADITPASVTVIFSSPPNDGNHMLLGGPLQTTATPTITGLGPNQTASFDAATSTITVSTLPTSSLQMPPVFSDHMVLQRDALAPVWGTADPGVQVTVTFAGQQKTTVAGTNGQWSVSLDPMPASSESRSLIVSVPGAQTEFTDVLVGEVWLCSGQSNMYRPIAGIPGQSGTAVEGYEQVLALPENPQLRLFCDDGHPLWNAMQWQRANSNTLSLFSAVAYFFGKKILDETNIPVGLIHVSRVGTTIQAWTPKEYALQAPVTAHYYALYESNKAEIQVWNQAPDPKPELPYELQVTRTFATVGGLYNNWMSELVPFAIRGVIWYQGEANATWEPTARHYEDMLRALADGLRGVWGRPDLPLYFVQLPIWAGSTSTHWPLIRQSMLNASLSVTNCGMAVTVDVGELNNAHPPKKREVGERLALWAMNNTYGSPRVFSGPLPVGATSEAPGVRMQFNTFGSALNVAGGAWTEIEAAGQDGVFHPATATVGSSNALITCPQVDNPVFVRYGWKPGFAPTLFNANGLPASPFCFGRRGDGSWGLVKGSDPVAFVTWSASGVALTRESLRQYAIGGAASPTTPGETTGTTVDADHLSITAIVRTNDPLLSVVGEAVTNLLNYAQPMSITTIKGSSIGVPQTNVPTNCERQCFRVPRAGQSRLFLRLNVSRSE